MLFEPDLTPPPLTRTEKLSRKVEGMIDRYHEGNSWKVGSMLLTVPGILGIALGGGLGLPPLVAMLFITSTVSAITTTVSYAYVESSELGTKPLFLPYSGEDVAHKLPEKEMYHWQAIRYMGFDVVEAIELWGKLDLLLDHVKFINMIDVPDEVYERVYIKKMVDIKALFTNAKPTDNPPKLNRTRTVFAPSPTEMTEYDRSPALVATADTFPPIRELPYEISTLKRHVLFVASTTSGKTTALTQVIAHALNKGHQVTVLDGKGNLALKDSGAVYRHCNTPERAVDAIDILERTVATMRTRQDLALRGQSDFTPISIVIDELNLVRAFLKQDSKESLDTFSGLLVHLLLQGASSGIFLRLAAHTSRLPKLGLDGGEADSLSFIGLGRNGSFESLEDILEFQISGRKSKKFQDDLDGLIHTEFKETLVFSTIAPMGFYRLPWVDQSSTAFTPPVTTELDIRSSLDRLYQSSTAPEPPPERITPEPVDNLNLEFPLGEILEHSKKNGTIKARDIQSNLNTCRKLSATDIRKYFLELETNQHGFTEGEGSSLTFTAYQD